MLLPGDSRVLGKNRDAALALQIVRVHHAVGNLCPAAERAGLLQQLVYEGGLSVVDVRDDRDVANLVYGGHGPGPGKSAGL